LNESKVLSEVPELKLGKECTFIGSLEAALDFLGENTDYIELMGMSGAAFRLQFHTIEWTTSSIDMFSRSESASFLGYYLEKYRLLNKDGRISTPKYDMMRIIKKEINSDRPVIGFNLMKALDWGVISGYQDGELLVRDYHEKEDMERVKGYVTAERFPNIIFTLNKNDYKPDKVESVKKSISFSVNKFRSNRLFDEYANGLSAYDAWINGLSDEKTFSDMDKETYKNYWLVNGLMYSNLYDARRSAHLFLERISEMIDDEDIKDAAEYYGDLKEIIWDNWIYFPLPFFLNKSRTTIQIPGGRYVEGNGWSGNMRKNGCKSLRLIKKMESRAVKRLEKAVEKWDEGQNEFMDKGFDKPRKGLV